MKKLDLLMCVVFCVGGTLFGSNEAKVDQADSRLYAAWKVVQDDRLGEVYYFYPDGVFVQQNPRRREFVRTGRWTIESEETIVLYDAVQRGFNLSEKHKADIRDERYRFGYRFEDDRTMKWMEAGDFEEIELQRIADLPNRTDNPYWGFYEKHLPESE